MREFLLNNKKRIVQVFILLVVFFFIVAFVNGRNIYQQKIKALEGKAVPTSLNR